MSSFTLPADSDLSAVAIYNVLDTDYGGGMSPSRTALQNAGALQAAIDAAQAQGGGIVLIPSIGPYNIEGTIYIGGSPTPYATPLVIMGTAQGTAKMPLLTKVQDDGVTPDNTDLFYVDTDTTDDDDIGGITFQNLHIQYVEGSTGGTAIHVADGQNVRILRTVFRDCPQAVWFEKALQCSIFECTAAYSGEGTNPVLPAPACISLGSDVGGTEAKEIYIAGCTFFNNGIGGTGVIIQGSEHIRMTNCRVEGFYSGIELVPGAAVSGGSNCLRHHFANVTVYAGPESASGNTAGTALTIQPQGPQHVANVVFEGCDFQPGDSLEASIGVGIYIDSGPDQAIVDTIRFVSCYSNRWTGPGIQINAGSNIEILGGMYAANNLDKTGTMPYGIAITGPATNVRISGVSCVGTYPFIKINEDDNSPTQEIGIYIAAEGILNIIIDNCDLTGNSEYALSITGTSTGVSQIFVRDCNMSGYTGLPAQISNVEILEITNCAGYNDQGYLTNTAPGNNAVFSGASLKGYYGPVLISVSGASQIQIDGHNTNLGAGMFTLGPRDSAKLTYSGLITFVMIGQ